PEDAKATPHKKSSDEELIEGDSRKRKRESQSLPEVLNWLHHVAKNSNDPSIGSIPESSKWSDYGNKDLWAQILFLREALLIKRHSKNSNASEHLHQDQHKKPIMHPTMYDDDALDHKWVEKLRCSKRITSSTKSPMCPCCNSCATATPESKVIIPQYEEEKNSFKEPTKPVITTKGTLLTNSNKKSSETPEERQVSIGPCFQANVPTWTGVVFESDSKWLGKRMWPPENRDKNSIIGSEFLIGNGKHDSFPCNCPFPNSVECVRFHIAENRLKLKQELGLIFHHWRFNRMGEEVSLSWTKEEEKIFNDMMRTYASFPNKFWSNASKFLRTKTRENLVSYYFNVFLVRRRSYQNRVTPNDVDSDDDEKECGYVGDSFGYKALYVPGSRFLTCTLNKEPSIELV
ncbi:hypothetical protein RD792_009145, partial [Penstemon davidsonii]